jgi:putative ABC transport system permease protein
VEMLFGFFTFLAIFIACLGLFGLSLFLVQRRTKEIGIRKVLGAKFRHISFVLTRDYIRLILISSVIAIPVAYFSVSRWLRGFAYRVNIGFIPFVLAGVLALVIAIMTVGFQVFKVARTNPVDVLKYE